ncbi:MAG: class II aldolase/adducin family protein [Planctomycetota bacterium]|nr:class II aldolase/adducin family protein [Planctomycetota bacterium]
MDEGVTKFACTWRPAPPPPGQAVAGLCRWRQRLHARGLVGHDRVHDVGFGNLSVRAPDGALYVSGTQTGGTEVLGPEHVARITDYDLEANHVGCEGPVQASSESLTHLALYELGPGVGGVIHVHAPALWARLRGVAPTTDPAVPYGTPAMAREVARLARAHPEGGVIVMAGHPDGLVAYGADLDAAGARLLAASEGSA